MDSSRPARQHSKLELCTERVRRTSWPTVSNHGNASAVTSKACPERSMYFLYLDQLTGHYSLNIYLTYLGSCKNYVLTYAQR